MTGRYKAYPEYRDSRVEWLGKLPSDWEVTRLKFITSIYGRIGFRGYTTADIVNEGEGALVLSPSNVYDGKLELSSKAFLSWEKYYESPEIIVEPNDILLVKTGSTYGKSAIVDDNSEPMTINPQMALLKNSKVPPKYLAYVMSSSLIKSIIEVSNTGSGMPTMTQENINSFPIPMPSNCWAEKIACFLDHETAKIDTLIAKQEKLIELLKEKRQAVISHAVTKGLNPNAPMRDSGVEWLGEVPEHWEVTKFNYVIDFLEGPGILAVDFHDEGIPLLRIQNVKEAVVTDNFKTFLDPLKVKDKWEHFRVNEGDLLISASASTGLISEVDERSVGAVPYTGLIRLKPVSENITKDFIRYIVQSDLFYEQIKLLQTGSTIQHFGPIHLQQMKVLLPPIYEQDKVCQHIKSVTLHIDHMSDKANKIIDLTKERKTALISAAVTGKIDVRNWHGNG